MEYGAPELCWLMGTRTRFTILRELEDGPKEVNALAAACGLSDSAVSQSLSKLKLAGLVTSNPKAQSRIYSLAEPLPPLVRYALAYDAGREA